MRSSERVFAATLAGLFLLAYGMLLWRSDFLPYVIDGNETYSAIAHGRNLIDFEFSKSYGLTDEAAGASPQAHPYVYTHQGNFPRVYSALLYAFGLRTPEAQIAATAATVGFGTLFLAFLFFARAGTPAFGFLTALVLGSDYLLFAQWAVNVYRAWHGLLLFAALVAVQRIVSEDRRLWSYINLVATFVCIGYFDLLMMVFTAILVFLFAAWELGRTRLRELVWIGFAQAAGLVLGVGILLTQLLFFYGWSGLRADISYTFRARNYTAVSSLDILPWREFFQSHRIVFWDNFSDSSSLLNVGAILQSFLQYGPGVHTPYFAVLISFIVCTWIVAVALPTLGALPDVARLYVGKLLSNRAGSIAAAMAVAAIWFRMETAYFILFRALLAGIVAFLLLELWTAMKRRRVNRTRISRAVLVACVLIATARRYRGVIVLALAAVCNMLIFHISAAPSILGRYSNGFVIFVAMCLCCFSAVIVLLFGRIDDTRLSQNQVALRLLRSLPDYACSFVFAAGVNLFLVVCLLTDQLVGLKIPLLPVYSVISGSFVTAAFIATITGLAYTRFLHARLMCFDRESRLYGGLAFAIGTAVAWWCTNRFDLYPVSAVPVWRLIAEHAGEMAMRPMLILGAASGVAAILVPARWIDSTLKRVLTFVTVFVAVGFAAFVVAYHLFPGYMLMVNLMRYSPLVGFLLAPVIAAALYTTGRVVYGFMDKWRSRRADGIVPQRLAWPLAGAACAGLLFAWIAVYWTVVQATYLRELPPNDASYLKKLREPPYKNASFVSMTYAMPIAVMTGRWAYMDPRFGVLGAYKLDPARGYVRDSENSQLWFADHKKAEYQSPDYALCFFTQSMSDVSHRVAHARIVATLNKQSKNAPLASPARGGTGCESLPLVSESLLGQTGLFRTTIADRDSSQPIKWAIVKLEKDFPPYLAPLAGSVRTLIDTTVVDSSPQRRLEVRYRYAQQQGRPEGNTTLRIVVDRDSSTRGETVFYDGKFQNNITLPKNLTGTLKVSISPRSDTREGEMFWSEPIRLSYGR